MIAVIASLVIATGGPRAVLSGPEETVVTADGHAVIHYTTEGVDAIDPEAVAWAEEGLATVWSAFVDDDGWPAPPPDAGIGGDDRLDLYLRVIDGNGFAHVESATGGCWMEADPGIAAGLGRATFASVVGHELHHCLQFAVTTALEGWIYEATSTYAQYLLFEGDGEDVALGLARDALWSIRLGGSERAFDDEEGTFEYAGMVWVKFLIDRAGGDRGALLALWDAMAAAGGWAAGHEAVLPDGLAAAAAEYGAWNVFACDRDDGLHYAADPAACGSALDVGGMVVTELPASGDGDVLGVYGSDYVELTPDLATQDLEVTVTAAGRVRAQLVSVVASGESPIEAVDLADGESATLTAPDWNELTRVVLVVTAFDPDATYAWSAEGSGVYVPPPEDDPAGCGCHGGHDAGGLLVLLIAAWLAFRR